MNTEQQRIISALEKIEGLRDIHVTPYGEVAWLTNNNHFHWLAKTWDDFCRILGTQAEIGILQLNRNP
jgi:hypothetical protein